MRLVAIGPRECTLYGPRSAPLGANLATEYFAARDKGSSHHMDMQSAKTSFWVRRAQATDKVAAALATISKPLAAHMVNLFLDLTIELQKAAILETGPVKVSVQVRVNVSMPQRRH